MGTQAPRRASCEPDRHGLPALSPHTGDITVHAIGNTRSRRRACTPCFCTVRMIRRSSTAPGGSIRPSPVPSRASPWPVLGDRRHQSRYRLAGGAVTSRGGAPGPRGADRGRSRRRGPDHHDAGLGHEADRVRHDREQCRGRAGPDNDAGLRSRGAWEAWTV